MQSGARMRQLAVILNSVPLELDSDSKVEHSQTKLPVKGNEQSLTDFSEVWISPRCTQKNGQKITLEAEPSIHIPASVVITT